MSVRAYSFHLEPSGFSGSFARFESVVAVFGSRRDEEAQDAYAAAHTAAQDQAILDGLRADDVSALAALARTYGETLLRVARVTTHDDARAQDIVQDVLFSLWERRSHLDVRGSLRGYLYRAVRFHAISIVRAERSRHRVENVLAHDAAANSSAVNAAIATLEDEALLAEVERALSRVAPQCREIFLLSWRAGLSYAEIAAQLGITLRTVYNQMYRAVSAIAKVFPELRRD